MVATRTRLAVILGPGIATHCVRLQRFRCFILPDCHHQHLGIVASRSMLSEVQDFVVAVNENLGGIFHFFCGPNPTCRTGQSSCFSKVFQNPNSTLDKQACLLVQASRLRFAPHHLRKLGQNQVNRFKSGNSDQ